MKRILSLFIAIAVFVVLNFTATAEALTVEDKIDYLISQGFPEDFLENNEVSAIDDIYNTFYGKDFQFLGTETVDMSESYSLFGASPLDTIPESAMRLKISSVQTIEYENGKGVIQEVVLYVQYEWFGGKPTICKKDGISVNWESGLFAFKQDSFRSIDYKKFLYYNYGYKTSDWIESDSQVDPTELNQGGLGYIAYLNRGNPPENPKELVGAKGWARMSLLPRYKIYNKDSKTTVINAEYVHNKSPFTAVGFSWNGAGVTVNLSSRAKDSVAKAVNIKYST